MYLSIRSNGPSLVVGQSWDIAATITDDHDRLVSGAVVAVSVTLPDGTVTAPAVVSTGASHRASLVVTQEGRHLAAVTSTGAAVASTVVAAWADAVTDGDGMPTVGEVIEYLGLESSVNHETVQRILNAEAAAQRRWCGVPAVYTPDLREALMRRCARNLAARAVPLSTYSAYDGQSASVPASDPEIARLEEPYRIPGIA